MPTASNRATAWAAAALVVVLGLVAAARVLSRREATPRIERIAAPSGERAPPGPTVVDAPTPAAADPRPGSWAISGRVVRRASIQPSDPSAAPGVAPVSGALVRIEDRADDVELRTGAEAFGPVAAATGEDGRFEFTGVPPRDYLAVHVDAPASAIRVFGFRLGSPSETSTVDLGDVLVEAPEPLTVDVVDPDGAPVAAARVWAADRSTGFLTTIPEGLRVWTVPIPAEPRGAGRFVISRLAASSWRVWAAAEGLAPAEPVNASTPAEGSVLLRMGDAWSLPGRVVNRAGDPVAGASVVPQRGGFLLSRPTSGADGGFILAHLDPQDRRVAVSAPGYARSQESVPEECSFLVLVLDREATIEGTVLGPKGDPLTGAAVLIAETARATSGPEGAFVLKGVPPGRHDLVFNHGDLRSAVLRGIDVSEGQAVSGVVARLEEGFALAAKVVDGATAEPIPEAWVRLTWHPIATGATSERMVRTDASGACILAGLEHQVCHLGAWAAGYLWNEVERLDLATREPEEVRIELERGQTVSGEVRDPEGRPVPGAFAALCPLARAEGLMPNEARGGLLLLRPPEARTDDHGRFSLRSVPPCASYQIFASHPRLASGFSEPFPVRAGAFVDGAAVRLTAGGAIEGQVVDDAGRPVPRAHVTAFVEREESGPRCGYERPVETTADEAGRFRIPRLRPEAYGVWVSQDGYGATPATTAAQVEDGQVSTVRVVLPGGPTISGDVRTPTGAPVPGVEVKAIEFRRMPAVILARTDANGAFVMRAMEETVYSVGARKRGFATAWRMVAVPAEPLSIVLRPAARIRGRVEVPGMGPVPAGQVGWRRWSSRGRPDGLEPSDFVSPSGDFELRVEPGRGEVVVRVPGFPDALHELTVDPGSEREVRVSLTRGGSIRGTIRDATTGEPLRAHVIVSDHPDSVEPGGTSASTRVNADADAQFEAIVPAGRFVVSAAAAGFRPRTVDDTVVLEGGATQVSLDLERGGGLHGLVVLDGAPCVGASVTARTVRGEPAGRTATGVGGRFLIDGLPDGEYRVRIEARSAAGSLRAREVVTAVGEPPQGAVVHLDDVPLTGRVLRDGAPVVGAVVEVYDTTFSDLRCVSDADGRYSLWLSEDESTMISVRPRDGAAVVKEVEVPAGAIELSRDFELPAP